MTNLHRSSLAALCLLPVLMAGCSSTLGSRFGGTPESKSIAVVGDRPLPSKTGEPGGTVAEAEEPEPRRDPKTRISGRVVDESGDPVAGATVRLADGGSKGGKQVQGTTDESGAFTLNGLRPGSSYVVIAEAEDDRGPVSGRLEARTARTGVEIVVGSEEKKPTARRSSSKPPRAKSVSSREDVEGAAGPEETTRINREDVARDGGEIDPGPPSPAAGRPQLGAPETGVGWKNTRKTTASRSSDADVENATASPDTPAKPRPAARPKAVADDEEEETNPLPPAIDSGGPAPNDEAAPVRPTSTKARKPKRAPSPPRESGDLSLAPEASLEPPVEERPAGPSIADKSPPLSPEPPPAAEVASSGSKEPGSSASGPPSLPPVGGDPIATASAPSPTPSPPGSPSSLQDVSISKPAPQPAFASDAPAEYNPFAQVAPSELLAESSPTRPSVERAKPSEAPVAQVQPAQAVEEPPRKKWGELAAAAAPAAPVAPAVVVEPTKATIPGPFGRRRRVQAQAESKGAAIALCSYDTKLRKITDFRLPDLEGRPVRFQDLDADYVLLDFWGTWCAPCLDAIPHLVELQKKYGPDRFKVVGIACEEVPPDQRKAKVDEVSKKLGINYPILLSTMDGKPCPVQSALQIQAMPTMILVDRRGQVVWRNSGSTPASDSRLDRVLALSMSRGDTVRR